jgi:hypothetical protein
MALGLRSSTPANTVLGEAKIPLLEIRFQYLARNFVSRMLKNEAHPLRTTLQVIVDWKETPVNIDRAGTVPLTEAFRDIVFKEHLIGKALLPLCCETTFTSIMCIPSVMIDRGLKFAASTKLTPLLFVTFSRS